MRQSEYDEQIRQWANLSTSSWNDDLLKAAVAKGTKWSDIFTGYKDLGNTTLGGGDSKLVSQYFAAKGYDRNEEWIRSNQDSYWARQLRDAQNWAMQNDKTQGLYQAEMNNKRVLVKQNDANEFKTNIENNQDGILRQLQESYEANSRNQQAALEQSRNEFRESQERYSRAAQEQETRRAEAERIRVLEQQRQGVQRTASRGLSGVDDDRYQGETQQYRTQADFIRGQLSTVGRDSSFLSNYDISDKATTANQLFDSYEQTRLRSPDELIGQYGGATEAQAELERMYAETQTGILGYDSQVRNNLSQLHSLYSNYNRLGDVRNAQGSTAQERVASLFGLNKVDTSPIQQQFGTQQESYNNQLDSLAQLLGGTLPDDLTKQYRNPFEALAEGLSAQTQSIGSLYNSGASQLHSLFGDAEAMGTGRAFNVAEQQRGLLSTEATKLGSTLNQASNLSTNLMSKYNETANTLRTNRTNERSAYYANEAQKRFSEGQASRLTNYSKNIGKQLSRSVVQPEADLQLNRHSLFN